MGVVKILLGGNHVTIRSEELNRIIKLYNSGVPEKEITVRHSRNWYFPQVPRTTLADIDEVPPQWKAKFTRPRWWDRL